MKDFVAHASVTIDGGADDVWEALTNPEVIKRYFFGTTVVTNWVVGGPILWKGEWKGQTYEDRGTVLRMDRGRRMAYTHFSPLSGQPDVPENYHTVEIELAGDGSRTRVQLSQDKNPSDEAREHSEGNWRVVLDGLKKVVEERRPPRKDPE